MPSSIIQGISFDDAQKMQAGQMPYPTATGAGPFTPATTDQLQNIARQFASMAPNNPDAYSGMLANLTARQSPQAWADYSKTLLAPVLGAQGNSPMLAGDNAQPTGQTYREYAGTKNDFVNLLNKGGDANSYYASSGMRPVMSLDAKGNGPGSGWTWNPTTQSQTANPTTTAQSNTSSADPTARVTKRDVWLSNFPASTATSDPVARATGSSVPLNLASSSSTGRNEFRPKDEGSGDGEWDLPIWMPGFPLPGSLGDQYPTDTRGGDNTGINGSGGGRGSGTTGTGGLGGGSTTTDPFAPGRTSGTRSTVRDAVLSNIPGVLGGVLSRTGGGNSNPAPTSNPSGTTYNTTFSNALNPNPFINSSGGFSYDALPGMFNNAQNVASYWNSLLQNNSGLANQLAAYLTGGAGQSNPLLGQNLQALGLLNGANSSLFGNSANYLNSFLPTMQGNLSYLNQYGLPGNQILQGNQQNYSNLANSLLGGGGAQGNWGLSDFYKQILQGGLPNQQAIQNIVPGALSGANQMLGGNGQYGVQDLLSQIMQAGLPGQGSMSDLVTQFSNQAKNGAMTPEYVNAMRQQILQPSQEAMMGRLNQQGGGVTQLPTYDQQSGLQNSDKGGVLAELMRRNERDFNNQLITQGFQMQPQYANTAMNAYGQVAGQMMPYAGLAANLGQNQIGNALRAYGIVPETIAPFSGQSSSLANSLMGNSLNNFNVGNSLGLQNLSTIQNLALQPYQLSQSGLLSGIGQGNQIYQQNLGNLQQFLNGQNNLGTSTGNQMLDVLRMLFGGYTGERQIQSAADIARAGQIGAAIPWLLNAAQSYFNPGGASGTNNGGFGTPPFVGR